MARTDQRRQEFLQQIKADFDERLARMAADPAQWVTFVEQVAAFGARYSLGNQMLLWMQAEQRGMQPSFFLPFGNKAGTSGWKKMGRTERKGERAFSVWAPIRRRPTEQEAARCEAAGHKVAREPDGRLAVQVVGFGLSPTFDLSQTDGEPFEPPTITRVRRQKVAGGGLPHLLGGEDPTGVTVERGVELHDFAEEPGDEGRAACVEAGTTTAPPTTSSDATVPTALGGRWPPWAAAAAATGGRSSSPTSNSAIVSHVSRSKGRPGLPLPAR